MFGLYTDNKKKARACAKCKKQLIAHEKKLAISRENQRKHKERKKMLSEWKLKDG